jgi:hypothetical protein
MPTPNFWLNPILSSLNKSGLRPIKAIYPQFAFQTHDCLYNNICKSLFLLNKLQNGSAEGGKKRPIDKGNSLQINLNPSCRHATSLLSGCVDDSVRGSAPLDLDSDSDSIRY